MANRQSDSSATGDASQALDVVAVRQSDQIILWVMPVRSATAAEYAIQMAVFRQGVHDRFFASAPSGKYAKGDKYEGDGA